MPQFSEFIPASNFIRNIAFDLQLFSVKLVRDRVSMKQVQVILLSVQKQSQTLDPE